MDLITYIPHIIAFISALASGVAIYQARASKKKIEAETKQIAITVSEKALAISGELNQELKDELDRLHVQVELLETRDEHKNSRIKLLEDKVYEDEAIISSLKESIKSLTDENRVLRGSLAALSDENRAMLERLESAEAQNVELTQHYTELTEENRKLRKQVADLRKALREYQNDNRVS